MPLRDHFRPPLDDEAAWESFHAQWPAMIVVALARQLAPRYVAGPRLRTGALAGPELDAYEVRVYDTKRHRRLVAAVEIVSPGNKDRPEHRAAFVAKCAALLQERVCVAIVDLVTTRQFNLYRDLLSLLGQSDPALGDEPTPTYAVSCRLTRPQESWLLEAWSHPLALGQPLPTLPLWLADSLAVPLDVEATYEETCRVLQLP